MDATLELAADEVAYLDEAGEIVVEQDLSGPGWDEEAVMVPEPQPHQLGPKMQMALEFIETHPGATKREVLEAAGVTCRPYGGAPDSVDRLRMRGLVYNLGRANRHSWYAWQPALNNGRPPGHWAPGHP